MSEPEFRHVRCGQDRGVLVLTITDRQVQGDELADELRREFAEAVEHYQTGRVVVDFRQVTFLSSAGFRPLLSLYRRLRDKGGSMLLCSLAHDVEEVFLVTRLISTGGSSPAPFDTAAGVEEAVARLSGPGGGA
jgi:anti-anti-sigma factor